MSPALSLASFVDLRSLDGHKDRAIVQARTATGSELFVTAISLRANVRTPGVEL